MTGINLGLYALNGPSGVAVDATGNVYIADTQNDRVLMVSADGTQVTTVAGQTGQAGSSGDGMPANQAELNVPYGLAFDSAGNLYISESMGNRIRMINAQTQIITTVAGNGTAGFGGDTGSATGAQLSGPEGIAIDTNNNLYIADTNNYVIREVSNGTITTVAGTPGMFGFTNVAATSSLLNAPTGVAVDDHGNLYIADFGAVREVTGGNMTALAGNGQNLFYSGDGQAANVKLAPSDVSVDSNGNVFIACAGNNRIVVLANGTITTVAGTGSYGHQSLPGPATTEDLHDPLGITIDKSNNLYIADTANNEVEKVTFVGAYAPSVNVTFSSGTSVTTAQTFNVTIAVTGAGSGAPTATGSVTLSNSPNGNYSASATLNNGAATIAVEPGQLVAGSYELTATYTPDSGSSSVYSTTSIMTPVDVAGAMPVLQITSSASSILSTQPLTVSITATAPVSGEPMPTGSVSVTSGTYTSSRVVLSGGMASVTIPGGTLPVGTDQLTVKYTPDSTIYVATSSSITQQVSSASNYTPTVSLQLQPSNSITTTQQLLVTVTVSTQSGKAAPTGTITLGSSAGGYQATTLPLSAGTAQFNIAGAELGLGTDTLTASYAPDQASLNTYNSALGMATVTVAPPQKIAPPLVVTPSATSITVAQSLNVTVTAQGNPQPTGTVSLSGPGFSPTMLPLSNGMVAIPISYGLLATGNDTLTATYTPDAISASIYTSSTGTATVIVTTIPLSTPAVTFVANPPSPNTAEAVTVTVSLSGTPSPSGKLTLSSGAYTSAAVALYGGSASFTIPAGTLPPGSNTLSAVYTPDAPAARVYNPTTATATLLVAPGGSFTVSNSTSSLSISPGSTTGNTATISVTPVSGFVGEINLACNVSTSLTNYNGQVTCTLGSGGTTKTSVMLNGGPATTTLTVLSTAAGGSTSASTLGHILGGGAALAGLLFFGWPARRRRWTTLPGVLLLAALFSLGNGCGSGSSSSNSSTTNPGTTAGPYIVTVTGTDAATGTLSSTNTVNVIIN